MSHVFSVYDGEEPRTFEEALEALEALDPAFDSYEAPTPRIVAFIEALLARWPDIGDEAGQQSPWSDGPMANNAAGGVIHVGVVESMIDEAQDFVVEVAKSLELVVVDQAEGRVLAPQNVPQPGHDEPDPRPPRRRWFRRG